MELQYFPMDRQMCTIEIESCKFDVRKNRKPEAKQCNRARASSNSLRYAIVILIIRDLELEQF